MIPDASFSLSLARAAMARRVTPRTPWNYEDGVLFLALGEAARRHRDEPLEAYVRQQLGQLVSPEGILESYRLEEFNLDLINPGKALFELWKASGDRRYRVGLDALRDQLRRQPRTASGGYWHKQIYPHQMWLDGLYMQGPFAARYAAEFGPEGDFDDVVHQFALVEQHARDPFSGLLYHAWDESCQQAWAHPATGCSPHFWSRAMGWYAMALVDSLPWFPPSHPGVERLTGILGRLAEAVLKVQDATTGLWYQVLDQGGRQGNYLESSGSAMFAYALLKGVRLGWLDEKFSGPAARGYRGLIQHRVIHDDQGRPSLEGICSVAGLGGTPYRDGSFAYYISEKQVSDDAKGTGPLILAALEVEALRDL